MSDQNKKPKIPHNLMKSRLSALVEPINNISVLSSFDAIPEGSIVVGTHDGSFHCDEALALGILRLHPDFSNLKYIVRTRKPELLEKCHVVVDVGAVYNPERHRYDHHQREFEGVFRSYSTRLSSAGLVYKHFGKEILASLIQLESPGNVTEELIEICYDKIYKDFMEHIDAIDNGIAVSNGEIKYHVSTTLSSRVGRLNPEWNEPQTSDVQNSRFKEAMKLTCTEFIENVQSLVNIWWPARSIVMNAINDRYNVDPSGKIIIFSQCCPWKEHLFDIEKEKNIDPIIIYTLYQDSGGSWRVQTVPVTPNSFESRKTLPQSWCGIRDQALSEKSNIPGCIFVHASGFIGGNQTKEGAIAMAKQALELL